jgi:glycosyltransferase involved in cell wall biosynthesis
MKIAIMAPLVTAIREPQQGGSQAFLSDLARGLAGRGHEVHVYAASGSHIPGVTVIDTGADPAALAGSLYRAFGPAGTASPVAEAAFAAAYTRLRDIGYDVVHNHAFDAPAIRLGAAVDGPVVHTVHLPPDRAVAAALHDVVRTGRPPAVATVSAVQAAAWGRIVPVDAVLPPLIPVDAIPWSETAGDGAVFAGRLSPEKGAAEAVDIAIAAGLPISVYGDAYDARYSAEQIGPRRARPGVTVHKAVPRRSLWPVMARASVVLCPSLWDEPFGMAAAEAQACGTPVVGFRRGALAEVIADGVTGFLVPSGDVPAAAAAAGKAAGISRRGCREHAERNLDLERSLDAHERLYRRISGGGDRSAGISPGGSRPGQPPAAGG